MRAIPRSGLMAALTAFAWAIGCGAGGNGDEPGLTPQDRSGAQGSVPAPGTAWVIFGADTVRAEVARTSAERSRGLMYREDVPEGTGMLFIFEDAQVRSFWMQNTYVALDIAFLDSRLRIVDIQQMEPLSETLHESRAPAMFALEVQQGWFERQGIRVGDQAEVVFGGAR
jgi:uncharacterized membrane protein (UPF0127 family)